MVLREKLLDLTDITIMTGIIGRLSLAEIAEKLADVDGRNGKVPSASLVSYRIDQLIKFDYVQRPAEKKARSIKLTERGRAQYDARKIQLNMK